MSDEEVAPGANESLDSSKSASLTAESSGSEKRDSSSADESEIELRLLLQQRGTPKPPGTPGHEEPKMDEGELASLDEIKTVVNDLIQRNVTSCNAQEKIVIVLDLAKDKESTAFETAKGSIMPFNLLKTSIEMFVTLKSFVSKRHQYALVVLKGNGAVWLQDFTNNLNTILSALEGLQQCEPEEILSLNLLFDQILSHVELPTAFTGESCETPFVVRVVMLYNRSLTIPTIEFTEEIDCYLNSQFFTFDTLVTHEPLEKMDLGEMILDTLESLNKNGVGYFFPVERCIATAYGCIAKLVSHPLQRPSQHDAEYTNDESK